MQTGCLKTNKGKVISIRFQLWIESNQDENLTNGSHVQEHNRSFKKNQGMKLCNWVHSKNQRNPPAGISKLMYILHQRDINCFALEIVLHFVHVATTSFQCLHSIQHTLSTYSMHTWFIYTLYSFIFAKIGWGVLQTSNVQEHQRSNN